MGSSAAIWSFKEFNLGIGELDFQADDGFLEAILSFVISLPTADIGQARMFSDLTRLVQWIPQGRAL